MNYEIEDILNEKHKLAFIMLRMHKKADKGVLSNLIMMQLVYNNLFIHILYIIISSIGLLTLCNDFIPDFKEHIYLSNYLRHLTPFIFVNKLQISNITYISICIIIVSTRDTNTLNILIISTKNINI